MERAHEHYYLLRDQRQIGNVPQEEPVTRQVEFADSTLNLVRSIGDQRAEGRLWDVGAHMSYEFDGVDATEKAGIEARAE
jgi:hypothetical protein